PDQSAADHIEVNVSNQLEKVRFFLANNGFVAILEKVPDAAASKVKIHGVAGQQSLHGMGKFAHAGHQQEMQVVRHECPGKAEGPRLRKYARQASDKVSVVRGAFK